MGFAQWIGLVALVLSLLILWEIRQLLLLLFVAVIFATAVNRLAKRLQRSGVKRGFAILLSIGGTFAFVILSTAIIVPPFLSQLQQLTQLVPEGFRQLELWLNGVTRNLPGGASQYIPTVDSLIEQLQPLASTLVNNFFRLFSGFFNITLSTLFIVVLTIMFALDPTTYRQGMVRLMPSFYRRRVDEILTLCEADLVGWIIGTLINMAVIGITSGIILAVLGVRLAFANALLSGLLEAVPNVGPILSTIAPTAIALLDAPWKAGAVIIAYFLMQQLEQYLLVPIVMGHQVSLPPAFTLLAQLAFASFFGFLGLLLAIPLLIIVRIILREVLIKDVMDRWNLATYPASQAEVAEAPVESTTTDPTTDAVVYTAAADHPEEPKKPASSGETKPR
ncbi:AI-2E family transporter [Leptolyngbya sp. AN02str]|uniref:AI-2E family transporter n=1 Tax=Leptolyngbya sp. AN02str TaxID=3423363 RepID=UPI003D31EABB